MRRAFACLAVLVLAGCGAHTSATQSTDAAGAPPGVRPIAVAGCEGVYYERDGQPNALIAWRTDKARR